VRNDLARRGFAGAVARWLPAAASMPAPSSTTDRWAKVVHRLGRRWPGSRCLDQSLALASLLRESGAAAILVIGAERRSAQVMAHAWVELGGQPLDEPDPPRQRFAVLDSWPKESACP
jgi:hypothetical protein